MDELEHLILGVIATWTNLLSVTMIACAFFDVENHVHAKALRHRVAPAWLASIINKEVFSLRLTGCCVKLVAALVLEKLGNKAQDISNSE